LEVLETIYVIVANMVLFLLVLLQCVPNKTLPKKSKQH